MTDNVISIKREFNWNIPIVSITHPDWNDQYKMMLLRDLLVLENENSSNIFTYQDSEPFNQLKDFLAHFTLDIAKRHANEQFAEDEETTNWQLSVYNSKVKTYQSGDYEMYSAETHQTGWCGIFCVSKDNSKANITFYGPIDNIAGDPLEFQGVSACPNISLEEGKLILYPSFVAKAIEPLLLNEEMTIVYFSSSVFLVDPDE